eukprot:Phypoly_transcript_05990.p1 GENE.Phypoly_transcript_05990~~Phypoly_transcript_05990.p1  ORF type:complete len:424 (+),score=33.04 Phypoly_transcript_05990:447-1718(+)
MFSLFAPIISALIPFKQPNFRLKWYSPLKVKEVAHFHLPDNVSHIYFADAFNSPLHLPPSVTHLYFGSKFNQTIKKLSPSVVSIEFPANSIFQNSIVYPPLLTHLTLGSSANTDSLPATLTQFSYGAPTCAAELIARLSNLKTLTIKGCFDSALDCFPPKLATLEATFHEAQHLDKLPWCLKTLTVNNFNKHIDNLPPSLTHLSLPDFNHPIIYLPASLTHLTVGDRFNHPIDHLPPSITHLTLGQKFDQPLDMLPPKLTHLKIPGDCKYHITHPPPTLAHLTVSKAENVWRFPIDNYPKTLTHLHMGHNYPFHDEKLPPLLTHFFCENTRNQIPGSLRKLPPSLISFHLNSPNREFDVQDVVRLPNIECFNLNTIRSTGQYHFCFGDKMKVFNFDRLQNERNPFLRLAVNFSTHEINISFCF